jgi:hypothetical protein
VLLLPGHAELVAAPVVADPQVDRWALRQTGGPVGSPSTL